MTFSANCPYCNALVTLSAPVSQRVICPRCSESFAPQSADPPASSTPTLSQEVDRHRQARESPSKGRVGIWLVTFVVLSSVVVGIWLWQQKKPALLNQPADVQRFYPPEDLPALRYLPAGTDSVIALQAPGSLKSDVRAALVSTGLSTEMVDSFEKNFGVSLDLLDQLVIAGRLKNGLELEKLVAVVHLRNPIEEERFAELFHVTLHHERKTQRKIYQTRNTPIINWWLATPQIAIGALSVDIFPEIPEIPLKGIEHLDPELIESIRSTVPRESTAWAVFHSEQFGAIVSLAANFRKELRRWQDGASEFRSVSISLTPAENAPIVTVNIQLRNERIADRWRSELTHRLEHNPGAKVSGEENRVRVIVPANAASIRLALGKK